MKKIANILPIALLSLFLTACGTTNTVNSFITRTSERPALKVTESVEISAPGQIGAAGIMLLGAPYTALGLPSKLVSTPHAAMLYLIFDPLAPNWTINEKQLNENTYHLSMRAKSFRVGGDGETMQILRRRAQQLQHEKAYADFRILSYSQRIESSTPFTRRVSEGTFQLVGAPVMPVQPTPARPAPEQPTVPEHPEPIPVQPTPEQSPAA